MRDRQRSPESVERLRHVVTTFRPCSVVMPDASRPRRRCLGWPRPSGGSGAPGVGEDRTLGGFSRMAGRVSLNATGHTAKEARPMIPTQTLKPKSVAREAPDDVAAKSHSAGRRRKEMFSSMKSGRRIVPLAVATATVALGLVAAPQAWAHTYLHAATAAITGDPIKARLDNAVYDWWAQPVSVNDRAYTWVGSIASAGTVRVAKVNRAAGSYQWATLSAIGDIYHDEHNTPALAFEDTKPYLMAFYTQHGTDNIMRYRTINRTTLAVGPLKTLTFSTTITYAQIIRNGTRLMVLTRAGESWRYRTSGDFGTTWSAEKVLINATGYGRVYSLLKPTPGDGDLNHLAFYGHPLTSSFRNVVYAQIHLQSGEVTLVNGQLIGNINDPAGPNLRPEQLQPAITPGTGFKVRLLDVYTIRNRPAIAYAVWNAGANEAGPATYKVKMYQDNNTWTTPPWSLAAGAPFGYDPAIHYLGGMAIGRDNSVYTSRETNGTWIFEKWAWSETLGTFTLAHTIARDTTQKLARPYVPARDGVTAVTINRLQTYTSYTNYVSDILVY